MKSSASKTGLFFGSFNPIHLGHLMIAGYAIEFTDLTEVWFILSPHNPLKEKDALLAEVNRLYMLNIAVEDEPKFRSSSIEFHLPQPSYTIDTLSVLQEQYPGKKFIILAGSDMLLSLHQWKDYGQLLEHYQFYIYPRPGIGSSQFDNHKSVTFLSAPLIGLSSSFIREGIRKRKNMQVFLPDKVWNYIDNMGFYRSMTP